MPNDYYPPGPIYDPAYKEDALPHCDPKEKQILDQYYYSKNYEQNQREDAPTLVDNLIPPPIKITNKEDQGEDQKRRMMEETLGKKKTEKKTKTRHRQMTLDMQQMRMIILTILIQTLSIKRDKGTMRLSKLL